EKKELEFIRSNLCNNKYPNAFINSVINKQSINIKDLHSSDTEIDDSYSKCITLPYYASNSMQLRRILEQFDYKVRFKSGKKLKNVLYFKSETQSKDFMSIKNVVYLLACNNCSEIYIGQTGRELKIRLNEHKSSNYKSSVYDHMILNNHQIDFENVKILHVEKNKRIREFKENWEINKHILRNIKLINTQLEKSTLPSQYYPFYWPSGQFVMSKIKTAVSFWTSQTLIL
ncbi:uncharacterized protein B4U80_06552, partial [Leptotrombidium deliense]